MNRREEALKRKCPVCMAPIGQSCLGERTIRRSVHAERLPKRFLREVRVRAAVRPHDSVRSDRIFDFYSSAPWRRLRYAVLRASDGRCVCCGARPSPGKPLHVDHIKPRSRFPDLELVRSNLQVLCDDCNLGKGNSDTRDWRDQQGSAAS